MPHLSISNESDQVPMDVTNDEPVNHSSSVSCGGLNSGCRFAIVYETAFHLIVRHIRIGRRDFAALIHDCLIALGQSFCSSIDTGNTQ